MQDLILIKLGGSIITDKTKEFTAREDNILRFAREIKSSLKNYKGKLIIGHGGGSFPHTPATKYKTKQGMISRDSVYGMALVGDAARQLNMIIVKNFLKEKIPVFTFSPSSYSLSDAKGGTRSYLDPLKKSLELGAVPVVYGDSMWDASQGCTIFSTETVLGEIAKYFNENYKIRIIYVSNVDGVYDANKKTITEITNKNFSLVKQSIVGSAGIDVTGGMLHKVQEALNLAKKYEIETEIINGNTKGNLKKAILGEKVLATFISN